MKNTKIISTKLIICLLCLIMFCGVFAINMFTSQKAPVVHAESSTTLKGKTKNLNDKYEWWWSAIDYNIENLTITNTNKPQTWEGEPVDVSEAGDGSLLAYKINIGGGKYDCVIHADVEKIYAPIDSTSLFCGYYENFNVLAEVKTIDFEGFSTENTTNMDGMFLLCRNLESVDLVDFDTTDVNFMNSMFLHCSSLTSDNTKFNLSNFNTSNLIDANLMFAGCDNLTKLVLTNFVTTKLNSMENMFSGCEKLESIDMSSFDLSGLNGQAMPFGVTETILKMQLGIPDNMTIQEFADQYLQGYVEYWTVPVMIPSPNLKEIKTPKVISAELLLPNDLYIDGDENKPVTVQTISGVGEFNMLTSAEQGKTLKALNTGSGNENVPSTGFVTEQLIPAITLGVASIIAVVYFALQKKKQYINK